MSEFRLDAYRISFGIFELYSIYSLETEQRATESFPRLKRFFCSCLNYRVSFLQSGSSQLFPSTQWGIFVSVGNGLEKGRQPSPRFFCAVNQQTHQRNTLEDTPALFCRLCFGVGVQVSFSRRNASSQLKMVLPPICMLCSHFKTLYHELWFHRLNSCGEEIFTTRVYKTSQIIKREDWKGFHIRVVKWYKLSKLSPRPARVSKSCC